MLRELIRASKEAVCQVVVDRGKSRGSGFLVEGTGCVLTCAHVINNAHDVHAIDLVFPDGRYSASVTRRPELVAIDVAVLQVIGTDLSATQGLRLGSFREVEPGDSVLIVGFPLGEPTLTAMAGIISAKGAFKFPDLREPVDALKLDASVNPGNSGGPCLDVATGKVVGIVSARSPVSAALTTSLGEDLAQAKKYLASPRPTIILGGVDPVALNVRLADLLYSAIEATRQLGIGYAISVDPLYASLGTLTAT